MAGATGTIGDGEVVVGYNLRVKKTADAHKGNRNKNVVELTVVLAESGNPGANNVEALTALDPFVGVGVGIVVGHFAKSSKASLLGGREAHGVGDDYFGHTTK